ncbi:hypothetical protein TI04_01580 [Achromatium sp. WMS2]|nr:hypothetical protein TI04_01580 [Achromatium sp. WMS2]
MAEANAWLLDLGANLFAAVSERGLSYLLADTPKMVYIPNSPDYCCQVLLWEGAIIPVMDIARRIEQREAKRSKANELIVLASFQGSVNAPIEYGALILGDIPHRVRINDDQACELPEPKFLWQQLAVSCFQHEQHGPVPILDLSKIFLTPPVILTKANVN